MLQGIHNDMFFQILFLFAVTEAGVVLCGGPKKSPVHQPQCRLYYHFGTLRSARIF